jgi:hypothetical protein
MPYQLDNVKFKRIELAIPRNSVNAFLCELWDEFNESIGRVACFHNYIDTEDPEIYEYNICWSDRELPFTAELSFINHTARGLTHVLVAAVDSETKIPDLVSEEKIINSIKNTLKKPLEEISKPSAYLQVPLKSKYKFSGNYKLQASCLLIHKDKNNKDISGYITFPVCSTNPTERYYEGSHLAVQIAGALTTLTQQYFEIDDQGTWAILNPVQFHDSWERTATNGGFINDSGFLEKTHSESNIIDLSQPTNEVIEEGDCIVDGLLFLPQKTDALLTLINNHERLKQSCSRFSEGLDLRNSAQHSINKIYLISYELIACVSAIEALLDTKQEKIEIKCPSCGEHVSKDEWKISEKFRIFIKEYTEENPVLEKAFRNLYDDRSKFVHTGINLHNFLAHRPNRPAILKGKLHLSDYPQYYFNIHEYTGYLLRRYIYRLTQRI